MSVANHIVPRVLAALRTYGLQPELLTSTHVAVHYTGPDGRKKAVTVTCLPTKNKQGELILRHGALRAAPACKASPRNIAKLGSVVASLIERNLGPTDFFLFVVSQQAERKGD